MSITSSDLHQLIREPSPRVRTHIALKVSESFNRSQFTSNENKLAIEIFRLLIRDTSAHVRRAMADSLKYSPQVPRDIMLSLIGDDAGIAVPMIECSELLNDDDLVMMIESSREVRKWLAVTRRAQISSRVSRSLIATRHGEVITSLLGNDGARIDERDYETLLDSYGTQQSILEALVFRGDLSLAFAEKLHAIAAQQLKKQLTRRYRLSWSLISAPIDAARESSMLRFFSSRMDDAELLSLSRQMHRNRRLSNTMIMRALLSGELRFVEMALGVRADIPQTHAQTLLADRGMLGFRTLYLAAAMPEDFLEAFDVILRYLRENAAACKGRHEDVRARLIDHVRTHGHDHAVPHMAELLELIQSPVHAKRTLH